MTHDKNCADCQGKGWYKDEAAPITVDCGCVDKPQAVLDEECDLCDGCGEVQVVQLDGKMDYHPCPQCISRERNAAQAELEAINKKLLEALKYYKKLHSHRQNRSGSEMYQERKINKMKRLMILESPLTGRIYATRAYKWLDVDKGHIQVTGGKEDVTEQIEAIIKNRMSI